MEGSRDGRKGRREGEEKIGLAGRNRVAAGGREVEREH